MGLSLVLAGDDTLYRAALSQSETAYNLGDLLFLGPLERAAAVQLTVEPLERMGTRWTDAALPERLVDALGGLPDLLQAAGRLLLLRLRGERASTLSAEDLDAVLDVFRFSVPLLREAIAALDVRFRIDQLRGGTSPASHG